MATTRGILRVSGPRPLPGEKHWTGVQISRSPDGARAPAEALRAKRGTAWSARTWTGDHVREPAARRMHPSVRLREDPTCAHTRRRSDAGHSRDNGERVKNPGLATMPSRSEEHTSELQ